jgi:hypothetical protein
MAPRISRAANEVGDWCGLSKEDRIFLTKLLRYVEQSGLHDFPNPQRKGCPSNETLESFARDPKSFPIKGPVFGHLTRCSNCFRFVHARRPASYIN